MARRFQFKLQPVLDLRKRAEEERVRELAQAKGRLLEIEREIRAHQEEEARFLEMYGGFERQNGTYRADQVMAYCDYQGWLAAREREFRRREREWAEETEKRRQKAVEASRGRRLLDNLKQRRERAHDLEVLGEEQRFLDELSSTAFARRGRSAAVEVAGEALKSRR